MMHEGTFANRDTHSKWTTIKRMMDSISNNETAYSIRRRLNPHHHVEDIRQEAKNFRLSQYSKWCDIKDLYAEYRDELANTQNTESFQVCKDILEKIFTADLDGALRETLKD